MVTGHYRTLVLSFNSLDMNSLKYADSRFTEYQTVMLSKHTNRKEYAEYAEYADSRFTEYHTVMLSKHRISYCHALKTH